MNKKTTFGNQLTDLTALFLIFIVALSMIMSTSLIYFLAFN